jgi:hypothetical protein
MIMRRFAFAAAFCAVAATASALAARPVPFKASIATDVTFTGPCGPTCSINISGAGQATHMGRVSIDGPSLIDFVTGGQTGTSTLTAADGSKLEIAIAGSFAPISATDVMFVGTWTAISGTGRFADSDASGAYRGTASLVTNTGELFIDGTITDTGRH